MFLLDSDASDDPSRGDDSGDTRTVVHSASDLAAASTCELAVLRSLDALLGRAPRVLQPADAMLVRTATLGDVHEQRVLQRYRDELGAWDPATGRGVIEIARPEGRLARSPAVLRAKHDETVAALSAGADVVYQGGFFDGRFSGWADFLVRVDRDSPAVYAVYDSKLARHAKVTALLQLAAYGDQLLAAGIPLAGDVHLILGDRTETRHRLDELLPVFRERRARLLSVLDQHRADDGPVAWGDPRFRACGRCEVCAPELERARDVLLVAGLRSTQRARLHEVGLRSIDDLAASTGPVAGIGAATLTSLRAQARLQVRQSPPASDGRPATPPNPSQSAEGSNPDQPASSASPIRPAPRVEFDLFAPEVVGHLPAPDPGDIFFDFEGDPLWVEGDSTVWGLEYLFGVVESPTTPAATPAFRPFWAHDRRQEKQALVDFLDYVTTRRAEHPGMHVYHYAAYERSALLRLAGRHGVGEDVVDELLRAGVLVDLYATVRASLRTGQRSYSIKKLEPLYMDSARDQEGVTTAGDSIVEYAQACALRDAGDVDGWTTRLVQIADYNEYDCVSTLRLRDWLLARAADHGVRPQPADHGEHPRDTDGIGIGIGIGSADLAATGTGSLGTTATDTGSLGTTATGTGSLGTTATGTEARGTTTPGTDAPEHDALAASLQRFADADGGVRTPDQQAVAMLGAALGYHWREDKPFWWAHFDRLVSDPDDWTEKRSTVVADEVSMIEPWHVPPRSRAARRRLRIVGRLEPGSDLRAGVSVFALYDAPVPSSASTSERGTRGWAAGITVVSVGPEPADPGARAGDRMAPRDVIVVDEAVKVGVVGHIEMPMALAPGRPPTTAGLALAIRTVAEQTVAGLPELPSQPALDILRRVPPRTGAPGGLPEVGSGPARYIDAITAALLGLDSSYLAVQGPPGTGKTYTGARVIARLVAHGWRIGVVAQSHAVVENMLRAVAGAGVPSDRIGKRPGGEPDTGAPWRHLTDEAAFGRFYAEHDASCGYVVGGTMWDFTNPRRLPTHVLDLLVVDEAGQFALASTVAVSGAARNLLLLGDPQQLPQVSQGTHPEPVDRSALGWLSDGHDTLPAALGYFLAESWRLHPELCAAVSQLSYEGRLTNVAATAERSLDGVEPGVHCVRVEHEGNAVASIEEAVAIVDLVRTVVGRRWRDPSHHAPARAVDRALAPGDIVVVAAYNAQVWTVRRALDDAGLTGVRVGTVDTFQGQEAPVVILSMAASSPDDVPRGVDFLLDRHRINVAVSRGQWCAYVVRSRGLTDYLPTTPDGLAALGAFVGLCERPTRPASRMVQLTAPDPAPEPRTDH